jgi:hypothetical protein
MFLRISLTLESLKEILINFWKLICVKAVQEVLFNNTQFLHFNNWNIWLASCSIETQ